MTFEQRLTILEAEVRSIKFRLGILIGLVAGTGIISGSHLLSAVV